MKNKEKSTSDTRVVFLVYYEGGNYDECYQSVIFATTERKTAREYVSKFNRILKKWKKYYSQFETEANSYTWIDNKYVDQHFNRWYSLRGIGKCSYREIPVR